MNPITFNIIVAINHTNTIGKNNALLWHCPNDLAFFKKTTQGHPVIMGRKTFESLPFLLPNRPHIVLTKNNNSSDQNDQQKSIFYENNLDDGLYTAEKISSKVPFIIGGGQIYKQALAHPGFNTLYLSLIDDHTKGDCFFPYDLKSLSERPFKAEKIISHENTKSHPAVSIYKIKKVF